MSLEKIVSNELGYNPKTEKIALFLTFGTFIAYKNLHPKREVNCISNDFVIDKNLLI